jgi:hypothetical protein
MDWLSDLVSRFVGDKDDRASAEALLLKVSDADEVGAAAFLELCRLVGESAADAGDLLASLDGASSRSLIASLGALVIACFAAVRMDYPSRQDAQKGRDDLAARADAVLDRAGAAFGPNLHSWLIRLVGVAVVQISAVAATRAPLVRVETNLSLPSSLIAYDLYGDPSRGAELMERNRVRTPLVMPIVLEAVSS